MVVERLKSCDNIVALAQELGLHRRLLYKWRDRLEPLEPGQEPVPSTPELRQQVRQLKRLLAEKTMEIDFFKGALQRMSCTSLLPCHRTATWYKREGEGFLGNGKESQCARPLLIVSRSESTSGGICSVAA